MFVCLRACLRPLMSRLRNTVINGLDVEVYANNATTIGPNIRCVADNAVCTGGKILVPTKTWSTPPDTTTIYAGGSPTPATSNHRLLAMRQASRENREKPLTCASALLWRRWHVLCEQIGRSIDRSRTRCDVCLAALSTSVVVRLDRECC